MPYQSQTAKIEPEDYPASSRGGTLFLDYYQYFPALFRRFIVRRTYIEHPADYLLDHSKHPCLRAASACRLGLSKTIQHSELLETGLQDEHIDIRYWCAWAMGLVGSLRSTEALRIMAEEEPNRANRKIAWKSYKALRTRELSARKIEPQNNEKLIEILLHSTDPLERTVAKSRLIRSRDDTLIPTLNKLMDYVQSDDILTDILDILGQMPPDKKLQAVLLDKITHNNQLIRQRSIHMLGEIGDYNAIPHLEELPETAIKLRLPLHDHDKQEIKSAVAKLKSKGEFQL